MATREELEKAIRFGVCLGNAPVLLDSCSVILCNSNFTREVKGEVVKTLLLNHSQTLREFSKQAKQYDIPFVYDFLTRLNTQYARVKKEARRYLSQ